jgi:hypothetical protein
MTFVLIEKFKPDVARLQNLTSLFAAFGGVQAVLVVVSIYNNRSKLPTSK